MSPGLIKMWTSLSALGFMSLSVFLIFLSRYKFKKRLFKITTAIFAYTFMLLSGIIMLAVVLGGSSTA